MDLNNCSLPDSFWIAASWARFTRLYVILPIYVVAGLGGRYLFLIAVCKEMKKDLSYRYQLFGVLAAACEIFAFTFYILSRLCSGVSGPGYSWFMKNYFLMWYSAHAVIPLTDTALTISLLLAVSTAADRVFVLTAPAVYKCINKTKHQNVALAICILLGISINTYRCLLYHLTNKETHYVMITNASFVEGSLSQTLEILSNVVKAICLLALIVFNTIIVFRYRQRFLKVDFVAACDYKKKVQRKKAEQTLILLIACESLFFSLTTCCMVIFFVSVTFVPRFNDCQAFLYGPTQNMVVMLASISDFYAALIISKQFRSMVRNALPFGKKTTVKMIFVSSKRQVKF